MSSPLLLRLLEAALGLALAVLILRDVFDTVVVPGRIHGALRIPRRLVTVGLLVWKRFHRQRIGVDFAPVVLVLAFLLWVMLLLLGFGLMIHAVRDSFQPPLRSLAESIYAAGSAMTTIGLGTGSVHGWARVVMLAAGFCGLAVVTLAVTYLLEVQTNLAQRDTGVLKIGTTAGQPPSGLVLMERHAALGCREEMVTLLRDGRDWCAHVLQSHASHLSLIYFRSAGTGPGWPGALGALIDAALIMELLVDQPSAYGPAVLAREQGDRLARELAKLLDLKPAAPTVGELEVQLLCERLQQAGYTLREHLDTGRFIAARSACVGRIDALSLHLGAAQVPLLAPAIPAS